MSFGGFMGLGHSHYPIPWGALTYDKSLGGFRTNITEQQLKTRPSSVTIPGRIAIGKLGHIVTTVHRNIGRRENACERTNISLTHRFTTTIARRAPCSRARGAPGTDSPPKKPVPPATGAGGRSPIQRVRRRYAARLCFSMISVS
jgi:hypothetical protein